MYWVLTASKIRDSPIEIDIETRNWRWWLVEQTGVGVGDEVGLGRDVVNSGPDLHPPALSDTTRWVTRFRSKR